MSYTIVGLGNPGEEYRKSRHNTGAMVVEHFARIHNSDEWENDTKLRAQKTNVTLGKENIQLVLPQTFMNKSGLAVKPFVSTAKKTELKLIVVYDDIDLPLGTIRVSYGRSSGGHRGLDSIISAIGRKDFIRLRIGVAQKTLTGKLKKPKGEQKVVDYLLANFSKRDDRVLGETIERAGEALSTIVLEGKEKAMNKFN